MIRKAANSRAEQVRPPGGDRSPVVVAVDAHPRGWGAVEWAAAEAAARRRPLCIVHVIGPPLPRDSFLPVLGPSAAVEAAGALVLDEAARRARAVVPELVVTTDLLIGAAATVVEISRDHALLVLARAAGRRPPGRAPAWPLVRNSRIPVAVVSLPDGMTPGPSTGRVVVGIGHSARSAPAVEFAIRAARRRGVGVTAVHACRAPQACPAVDRALRTGRAVTPEVEIRRRIVDGRPGAVLVAESVGAALLVVGASTRRRLPGMAGRSVARAVVDTAESPLVVVPADRLNRRRRPDQGSTRHVDGCRPGVDRATMSPRTTHAKEIPMDVATLADLLHETAEHHDSFEKAAPPHDWWDWYAPYLNARQDGRTPEQATEDADRYMQEVRGVVRGSLR